MKLIDKYERNLMISTEDTELAEDIPPGKLSTVCAWCGKMRDDDGLWRDTLNQEQLSHYGRLTHGICPECLAYLRY